MLCKQAFKLKVEVKFGLTLGERPLIPFSSVSYQNSLGGGTNVFSVYKKILIKFFYIQQIILPSHSPRR
jgi:hypothetical protein